MNRVARWVTAIGVGASALATQPRAAAAQSIPVTVGGNASSLVGVDFEMPIEIDMSARAEKLGSFALTVRWNPLVLQILAGTSGSFGGMTVNDDSLPAGVLIASGANPAGVGGKVTVALARMRPLIDDTTTISISVQELFAATSFADLAPNAVVTDRLYCTALGRYGDMDGDGAANSRDALLALSAAVGIAVPANVALGDVDADADTDARDALIILSNAVGLDVTGFRVFVIAPGSCATTTTLPGFTLDPGDLAVLVGQTVLYTAIHTDSAGNAVSLSDLFWRTSNDRVAVVTPDGFVATLDTGIAVITAIRSGTADTASATLTVIANRPTHWVDASAVNAENQLGTAALPFATIHQGVAIAGLGDTVRVRPGRYEPFIQVNQGVVIYGEADTLTGALPVIAATSGFETGITVLASSSVELHNFRMDTLFIPINIFRAETVLIRNVEFRGPADGFTSVLVTDTVLALLVENSRFVGSGMNVFANHGILADGYMKLLRIDSSLFAEHGSDGVVLYDTDSLYMRGSVVRDNNGYGLSACRACFGDTTTSTAVVLTGNTFRDNMFGAVKVDRYRTAQFDHNLIVGSGYDAIQLFGASGLVTFLADSIDLEEFSAWLFLERFDSLFADSLKVRQPDARARIDVGRIAVFQNSSFFDLTSGNAIDVDPFSIFDLTDGSPINGGPFPLASTQLVLRNVEFLGRPGTGACCPAGVQSEFTTIDADGVTGSDLDNVIQMFNAGPLTLTNGNFSNNFEAIQSFDGSVSLSNTTSVDDQTTVQVFGGSPDSVVVDNLTSSGRGHGVQSFGAHVVVTNSSFTDKDHAVQVFDSSIVATGNQIVRPMFKGIQFFDPASGGATISGNTITCDPPLSTFVAGIEGFDGPMTIENNTIDGCTRGIDVFAVAGFPLTAPVPLVIRQNTITVPSTSSSTGITAGGSFALIRVVENTLTGPWQRGSIDISGTTPLAEVDSNTITGSIEAAIYANRVDTLRIRDNVITDHGAATCCIGGISGAIFLGLSASTNAKADVRRNRITDTKTSGIVLQRTFGDTVTILVDSNTVKRADSVGIWVADYSKALLRYNAIDSALLDAVQVSQFSAVVPAIANFNNLSNSGRYGVNNVSIAIIDATSNWWNDALGPSGSNGDVASLGDSMSTNVTFSPFLTAPANAPLPTPPAFVAAVTQEAPSTDAAESPEHLRDLGAGALPAQIEASVRNPEPRPLLPRALPPNNAAFADRVRELDRRLSEHQANRLEERARRAARQAARIERAVERARNVMKRAEQRMKARGAERSEGQP